jgi:nitrite reductase/ring-hydroxylating ferredoxin subunit
MVNAASPVVDSIPGRLSDLPPFPVGWFAIAFSEELGPGQVQRGGWLGQELVLFRTRAGRAVVMDAHCPHMGAHMGHGGVVIGEGLRCPFHGFCFSADGACVSTPYGGKLPKIRAGIWPVVERNGHIFIWYAPDGRPPAWEIPVLDADGYGRLHRVTWRKLASHPQETTENSVDIGHLSVVHGYERVESLAPLHTEGPYLSARYAMSRRNPFVPGLGSVRTEFDVHVHGLGYSFVHAHVREQAIHTRHFVCATPLGGEHIELRISTALRLDDPRRLLGPLALVPRWVLTRMVGALVLRAFRHDVAQDFEIWSNKRYVQPPSLAEGDGPVGPYRAWCRQFYAGPPACSA